MKQLKLLLASLTMTLGIATFGLQPVLVHAQFTNTKHAACLGVSAAGEACNDDGTGISRVIGNMITALGIVIGVAAIIMIIIGGLKYVTSGGDASSVASAKRTILYAVIGMVVVAVTQFLVRFVLSRV